MASPSAIAKYIKSAGTYSEGELSDTIGNLSKVDREWLHKIVRKIHGDLRSTNLERVDGKQKERKTAASGAEKFDLMVLKIKQRLDAYEGSETVDKWHLNFEIGLNFEEFRSIKSLVEFHQRLVTAGCGLERTKLLAIAGKVLFSQLINQTIIIYYC